MPRLSAGAARFLEHGLEGGHGAVTARLQRSGPGWRLGSGRPRAGDRVLERGGRVLLVMSEEVADELDGAVIDLHQTGRGPRLVIAGD